MLIVYVGMAAQAVQSDHFHVNSCIYDSISSILVPCSLCCVIQFGVVLVIICIQTNTCCYCREIQLAKNEPFSHSIQEQGKKPSCVYIC